MKYSFPKNIKLPVTLVTLCFIVLYGCKNKDSELNGINKVNTATEETKGNDQSMQYAVEPPPFSDGIYPCNDCHANFAPNPVRRNLTWHEDITAIFNHDSENRWCLDCHDLKNRNFLRLANGDLLDFKESYKLCGQCHGEKYRDWKVGVHGKRTGEWNGKKEYLLCVSCHNPHAPKFKELIPDPPPVKQEDIK